MSLCYCFRRRWHVLKNINGYNEETRKPYSKSSWKTFRKQEENRRHEDFRDNYRQEFDEAKVYSENWCIHWIPKRQVYQAYGIVFESREERDAFEIKMQVMEKILENELYEIRQQHVRLQEERTKLARLKQMKAQRKADSSSSTDFTAERLNDVSMFCSIDGNPLLEEVSLVNDIQDVLDLMCELSRELKDIEKVLNIEVRERTLHPEPRLIQIKAPEDKLSEQMKMMEDLDIVVQTIKWKGFPMILYHHH